MTGYRDMTFCRGAGCAKFAGCPRALTPEVRAAAQRWWRGPNPPIAQFSNPRGLTCYVKPESKP